MEGLYTEMEYITVHEAAEKWNISKRLVQKYCAYGRIKGAKKCGTSWKVPAEAKKPDDLRKVKQRWKNSHAVAVFNCSGIMPLMNTEFQIGHCREYIENMNEGQKKTIALAEYYYFSGQPQLAAEKAEKYLSCSNPEIRLSACLIFAYSNLSIGEINKAKYALLKVKYACSNKEEKVSPQLKAAEAFVSYAASILLHLPLPKDFPTIQDYLPLLPPGLRAFALYVMAHSTYLQEDYQKSLGIVEAALAIYGKSYPIPAIYLHLAAVMDYISLKQLENAQKHLLAAWEIAKPDDLIEGFGEHHGLLGGTLESVIKRDYPEDFKRIIAITYRFSAGWRSIHNPVTGDNVADNLTTTEFAAAMLAARGWTNQEIGEHMNISPNTVKRYISTALQKLNINSRKDLKKHMLP